MRIRTVGLFAALLACAVTTRAQDVLRGVRVEAPFMWHSENFEFFKQQEEILDGVQKALKLTPIQVTAVKALLELKSSTLETATQEAGQKQEALQKLLEQRSASAIEIGNAYLAVQAAEETVRAVEEKFQVDFQGLLTPAQRVMLQNFKNADSDMEALREFGVLGNERHHFSFALPFAETAVWTGEVGTAGVHIKRR